MACDSPDSELLETFRYMAERYRLPPRGSAAQDPGQRAAFTYANEELYHMAQGLAPSAVQQRLMEARRAVVKALNDALAKQDKSLSLQPRKLHRPIRWSEYLLTPELEGNLALTGSLVPRELARELQAAHREQIQAIMELMRRR